MAAAACVASSCSSENGEAEINASVQRLVAAVDAKDISAYYTPNESLLVFDPVLPRQYAGARSFRKDAFPGAVHAELSDWKAESEGNLPSEHGIFRTTGSTLRVTDAYSRKINGKWLVICKYVSMASGFGDRQSGPQL